MRRKERRHGLFLAVQADAAQYVKYQNLGVQNL
jgi:hypothetical protein